MDTSQIDILNILLSLANIVMLGLNSLRFRETERFKSDLAKDLELYKSELSNQRDTQMQQINHHNQVELEKYKAEIHKEAISHEVTITTLNTIRADAIREIYKGLIETSDSFKQLTSLFETASMPDKESRAKLFIEYYESSIQYFRKNRLLLNQEICDSIEAYQNEFLKPFIEFRIYVMNPQSFDHTSSIDTWLAVAAKATQDMPAILDGLEESFREILGVKAK
jgi:hypothetical protein